MIVVEEVVLVVEVVKVELLVDVKDGVLVNVVVVVVSCDVETALDTITTDPDVIPVMSKAVYGVQKALVTSSMAILELFVTVLSTRRHLSYSQQYLQQYITVGVVGSSVVSQGSIRGLSPGLEKRLV